MVFLVQRTENVHFGVTAHVRQVLQRVYSSHPSFRIRTCKTQERGSYCNVSLKIVQVDYNRGKAVSVLASFCLGSLMDRGKP